MTRPTNSAPAAVTLFAYDNIHATPIYSAAAGTWPSTNGNANIVPVVGNGRVYVASYGRLAIFGLGGSTATMAKAISSGPISPPEEGQRISGTIERINGSLITLRARSRRVEVDTTKAQAADLSYALIIGGSVLARGTRDATGLLHADAILRAKASPEQWPPDR